MCNLYNAQRQFNAFAEDIRARFDEVMETRHRDMPPHAQATLDNYLESVRRIFGERAITLARPHHTKTQPARAPAWSKHRYQSARWLRHGRACTQATRSSSCRSFWAS
eukprot:COSAG01_NODE_25978_length_727_cov_1.101911_1_plen_108_part_00